MPGRSKLKLEKAQEELRLLAWEHVCIPKRNDAKLWSLTKPERDRMKRAIEDLMFQILIDLIFRGLVRLVEWASAIPFG